ncbi:MAG: DHH family phosphoesterase [Bdellovibrionota bacterium]|nr:DHH family phosphoesterase [Bdellovibrionota bacterium]
MKELLEKIKAADHILLSTHRAPDGDGFGAEVALYHALMKIKKKVHLLHVDEPAFKYNFLRKKVRLDIFNKEKTPDPKLANLILVFDTNDGRMLPGLWEWVTENNVEFAFIDHHPFLEDAPNIGRLSHINTEAASTGEIVFSMIKDLNIEMDENIAEALYTSVCFDTQLFRYVKSSAISHVIAAEVIPFIDEPESIHDHLFGNIPIEKFRFLAYCTSKIEFHFNNQFAYLEITDEDLIRFNMSSEDTRDLTDHILGVDSVEISLVVIPAEGGKKLSIRSKKPLRVLELAKLWHGGGHPYASGAYIPADSKSLVNLKKDILSEVKNLL